MGLLKFNNDLGFPTLFDDFLSPEVFGGLTLQGSGVGNVPAVNIKETDKGFQIDFAAPGMNKKDFNIEVDDNVLTVSSEKEEKHEEKDKDGRYTRKEFSYTTFKRSFTLPENVNTDKIKANYNDGLLQIEVPKKEIKPHNPKRLIKVS